MAEPMCEGDAHYFWTEDDEPTPAYCECLCQEVTWGQMDELLQLTTMWDLTHG